MLNWLKKILGIGPSVPAAVEAAIPAPEEKPTSKTKTQKKNAKTKEKVVTIDLNKQTKKNLLIHAKAQGIKANASMNKADIIKAIKNG
jgi:hypothetical protein